MENECFDYCFYLIQGVFALALVMKAIAKQSKMEWMRMEQKQSEARNKCRICKDIYKFKTMVIVFIVCSVFVRQQL